MRLGIFTILLISILIIGFSSSYAPSHPEFIGTNLTEIYVYHFNKGVVDEQSSFAGEVIWTLINGNEGAIVHSSDHGVVVVRFSLSLSDVCIESIGAICLDGKVTQFKNTDSHNQGEDLKIIIDATNNEEIISMVNGPLAGVDVKINLDKIRTPQAEDIAKRFVFSASTFSFDGIPESVKVGMIAVLESYPPQYIIPIDFDSLHGGYGDRTDQMVTQVITPHTIRVTVVNGMVTSAIIDGKWDELNQLQLPGTSTKGPDETVSHENVVEFSLVYTKEGGIAGISESIIIDSSKKTLIKRTAQGQTEILLDESQISSLLDTINEAELLWMGSLLYAPAEGWADYFIYTLRVKSGDMESNITWTDTNDVPENLVLISQKIEKIIEMNS